MSGTVQAESGTAAARETASVESGAAGQSMARAWYTVWLIAFITTLSQIDRNIINLLVEPIKRDLLLSDTQIGLVVGLAFSLLYMMVGLPMARVSDVKSRKWILGLGLMVWSVATALCGMARGFYQLFAARALVGGSESVAGPSAISMISDLIPRERLPRAFAIYQLGISAGQAFALFLGGALIALFASIAPVRLPVFGPMEEWQLVFLVCAVPGIITALIWLFTVKEPARTNRRVKGSIPLRDIGGFLFNHRTLYLPLFLSIAVGSIETMGLLTWRPAFYERTYGWGPEQIGPLLALALVISTPIALVTGTWLAEFLGKRGDPAVLVKVCFMTQALSAPFAIAGPLMPDPWLAYLCGILGSIFGLMAAPAQNAAIQIITPNEMRAQITALYLFSISVIGTGLGPLMVALVTDFVLQDEALLRYSMAGFATIMAPGGALLMWLAIKPYGRRVRTVDAGEG